MIQYKNSIDGGFIYLFFIISHNNWSKRICNESLKLIAQYVHINIYIFLLKINHKKDVEFTIYTSTYNHVTYSNFIKNTYC